MASAFETVIELERRLLDPVVRADRSAVDSLLHPEFTEIGASGRLWQRQEIIDAIAADAERSDTPTATHFEAAGIAPDTVLLTYVCDGTRRARRSSIWQGVDGDWLLRFHQGTPTG